MCDPRLTAAGAHDTYLTLVLFSQRCFSGLSLLQSVCIQCVCLFILMMRVHPTA